MNNNIAFPPFSVKGQGQYNNLKELDSTDDLINSLLFLLCLNDHRNSLPLFYFSQKS